MCSPHTRLYSLSIVYRRRSCSLLDVGRLVMPWESWHLGCNCPSLICAHSHSIPELHSKYNSSPAPPKCTILGAKNLSCKHQPHPNYEFGFSGAEKKTLWSIISRAKVGLLPGLVGSNISTGGIFSMPRLLPCAARQQWRGCIQSPSSAPPFPSPFYHLG